MILVVFHTAGINEKKKGKKKIWYRTWMGYCPIELRAGLGTGRVAGRTARSRRWASVRAGRARRERQAGVSGRGAQGVLGRAGRQAHGRWRSRARVGERQLGAGAGGRQGARRAAGRWARGRQALGARGLGAWAGLGQCTRCTRPIFDPF